MKYEKINIIPLRGKILIFTFIFFNILNCFADERDFKSGNKLKMSNQLETWYISTKYSNLETIVIQVYSRAKMGSVTINNNSANTNFVNVFIPKPNTNGSYYHCPFDYFQKMTSLNSGRIIDDYGQILPVNNSSLKKAILTKKISNYEEIINIPEWINQRLLEFFQLEISQNSNEYYGFDCYAFISFIFNLEYHKESPPFEYIRQAPNVGDIVVLTDGDYLPVSIKHWALYLGDDTYISKFGMSGMGADALINVMDLEGMKDLYKCHNVFIASPKKDAPHWSGLYYN